MTCFVSKEKYRVIEHNPNHDNECLKQLMSKKFTTSEPILFNEKKESLVPIPGKQDILTLSQCI